MTESAEQKSEKLNDKDKIKTARVFEKGDELFSCSRCGTCLSVCPVYKQTLDEGVAPRGKLSLIEAVSSKKVPLTDKLSRRIYTCTLCNYCTKECPSGVKINELFSAVRSDLVDNKKYPEILDFLNERISKAYNITFDTNQGRLDWLKQMPDVNFEDYLKDNAEIVYFVGCVASYSPRSFIIPRSVTQIFKKAGVDFTLLGEDEWCCGFPLKSSGMHDQTINLADHNIKRISDKKAKILITSCPSCYHTWKYEYPEIANEKINFEIMHISQYLDKLIRDKKIKLKPMSAKVTYHDPCDLGRNSGIIEEPREVIKSIPGVEFVELSSSGIQSNCCGGGGNLESLNPSLSAKIAEARCTEIISTGADTVVSGCQQCERTISTAIKKKKDEINYKIKVMDISELVNQAME